MMNRTRLVPIQLASGDLIKAEVAVLDAEQEVSFSVGTLDFLAAAITEISSQVLSSLAKAKPQKVAIELGLEIGIETGKLVAIIPRLAGKANIHVKLEWTATCEQK